jgi:hypothetical protein
MEDLIHDDSKCKKVAFVRINTFLNGLRWHVKGSANIHGINEGFFAFDSKSKIGDFEGVSSSENILWFQVPVQDALLKQVATSLNDLFHEFDRAILRDFLVSEGLKILGKIALLAQLQHNVNKLGGIKDIITLDNELMIKPGMELNLIPDKFHLIG